jgi:hypothetical protein
LRELGGEQRRRVGLGEERSLEVEAGGEAEVLVGGAGVAVVADDALGQEVAGPGREVDNVDVVAQVLDAGDANHGSAPLEGGALEPRYADGAGQMREAALASPPSG